MKVLTLGTFDIPHAGHVAFLQQAARFGDLTVGVNTDQFVTDYKGIAPLFDFTERVAAIARLGYTVVKNDSAGADCIYNEEPDVIVVGSDWAVKDYHSQIGMSQKSLDALGICLVYVPYTPGLSTSEIKRRCRA